jgi:hypothetical protein
MQARKEANHVRKASFFSKCDEGPGLTRPMRPLGGCLRDRDPESRTRCAERMGTSEVQLFSERFRVWGQLWIEGSIVTEFPLCLSVPH